MLLAMHAKRRGADGGNADPLQTLGIRGRRDMKTKTVYPREETGRTFVPPGIKNRYDCWP